MSVPVGVYYLGKTLTGEERYAQFSRMIEKVQICYNCVNTVNTTDNVLTGERRCVSTCDECIHQERVCDNCQLLGHVSHLQQLRKCDFCIRDNIPCSKLAVMVLSSDCETKNKVALETFQKKYTTNTLPADLKLVSAIPDAMHLGKSFKCSWSNWFIIAAPAYQ